LAAVDACNLFLCIITPFYGSGKDGADLSPFGQDIPFSFRNEIFIREGARSRRTDVETIKDMVMRRQVEPERWKRRFSDANLERDLDQAAKDRARGYRTTKNLIAMIYMIGGKLNFGLPT